MSQKNFVVFLLLLVTTYALDNNDVSLKDIVKQLLHISPPKRPLGEFHKDQQPPKHMLELYHRFTVGRRSSGETVRSITPSNYAVGGRHPHPVGLTFRISRVDPDDELRLAQLVLRRRRIARHPHSLHRKLLPPPYRVRVFEIVDSGGKIRTVPLASIPVPQVTRGGWHSLDITSAVRELLLSSAGPDKTHILGVRFEAPKSKVIPASHFLEQKNNNTAFLMLFIEESRDNDEKQNVEKKSQIAEKHVEIMTKHSKVNHKDSDDQEHAKQRHYLHHSRGKEKDNPRRHKNRNNDDLNTDDNNINIDNGENTDIKELLNMNQINKLKRHKKIYKNYKLKYDDDKESESRIKIKSNLIEELLENSDTKRVIRSPDSEHTQTQKKNNEENSNERVKRSVDEMPENKSKAHRRRSIYDNELPYEKLHLKDVVSKRLTTTELPEVVTEFLAPDDEDDRNLIPYPPGTERKRKRKLRRGKKRNHKGRTKLLDVWNKDETERHTRLHGSPPLIESNNITCSKRHLNVNFKELGWSDWIVAPEDFKAHYCVGSCNFSIPMNVPVTNHAIIQSMIHRRGLNEDVPAPCCVPHSMSPLTILYLEDTDHIVLRNYRSMIVESCGCR